MTCTYSIISIRSRAFEIQNHLFGRFQNILFLLCMWCLDKRYYIDVHINVFPMHTYPTLCGVVFFALYWDSITVWMQHNNLCEFVHICLSTSCVWTFVWNQVEFFLSHHLDMINYNRGISNISWHCFNKVSIVVTVNYISQCLGSIKCISIYH